ncbi:sensor histidine kinase [Nonomuraea sp. NPDC049309]|uniref:sensor histidine kinase n=1 Tax=Nonomuraea sp. NPDC049309 TaxID=3364350 RepID=UPI00371C17CA
MHVSPRPFPRILRLVAIVLVGAVQTRTALTAGPSGVILGCALVLALALALLPFRIAGRSSADTPLPVAGLAVATVIAAVLHDMTPDGASALVMLACVVAATSRMPLPKSLVVTATAIVALLVSGAITGDVSKNLTLAFSTSLVFLITYAAAQRKAIRQAEAREAVLAERARIARELHDILAHSLSAQLVHLEGAKLLLRAERTEEALDRVVRARDLAKSGLEEARRAVAALREDPPELPVALRRLKEEFESTTRLPCTLRISGPERRLTPEAELALTRTAQEALTNIRRHAPGAPASITLTFSPTWCDLRITNPAALTPRPHSPATTTPENRPQDGSSVAPRTLGASASDQRPHPFSDPAPAQQPHTHDDPAPGQRPHALNEPTPKQEPTGGGHGLIGMRERAELLGGTLTAGADGQGFTVHVRVPA